MVSGIEASEAGDILLAHSASCGSEYRKSREPAKPGSPSCADFARDGVGSGRHIYEHYPSDKYVYAPNAELQNEKLAAKS